MVALLIETATTQLCCGARLLEHVLPPMDSALSPETEKAGGATAELLTLVMVTVRYRSG
jgi:hypothetical protein